MKYLLLSTLLSIAAISCSDVEQPDIEGSYDIVSVTLANCMDPESNITLGLGSEDCITALDIEYCHQGLFFLDDGSFSVLFTLSYLDQSIRIASEGEYSLKGTSLEMNTSDGSMVSSVNPANTREQRLSINYFDVDSGCEVRFAGKLQ